MANTIDRLKSQLLASGIQQKNQALFQVINQLIDNAGKSVRDLEAFVGGGSSSILNQSFITVDDDKATLPLSRRLIAGAGINFNDQGDDLIINSSIPFGIDVIDGEVGPVGPQGLQGIQGLIGPQGPAFGLMPLDNENEEPLISLPFGDVIYPPPGIAVDIPYNASNFSSNVGTWTVDSADQIGFNYTIINRMMILGWTLNGTSISGGPSQLRITIPGGILPTLQSTVLCRVNDNGTERMGIATAVAGQSYIGINAVSFATATTTAFAASTNNTSIQGSIPFFF